MHCQPASPPGGARGSESIPGPLPFAAPDFRFKRTSVALSFGLHAAILAWILHATALPAGHDQPGDTISAEVIATLAPSVPQEIHDEVPPETVTPAVPSHPPRPRPSPVKLPVKMPRSSPAPVIKQESEAPANFRIPSDDRTSPPSAGTTTSEPPAAAEDILRLYGEAIRARIQNRRPTAIRSHGTVGLTFTVSSDGHLIAATISESSGLAELDQAALLTLQKAAPFPPFPEPATERQVTFSIPFHFH